WTRKEVSNSYYGIGVEIEMLEKQNERARKLLENIRPDLNKEEKFRLQIVDKIDELRNGEFVSGQEKDKNFRDLISALETQNIFKKVARKVLEVPWARAETKTLIDTAKSSLWDFIEVSEERYINSPASVMNLEIGLIDYLVEKVLSVYGRDETSKKISPNIDVETAERLNCPKSVNSFSF
ncbi:hypothetical protein KAR91_30980, partial [Candidatus Pacearchaeota archaeon]|nr:hypothetical protein [Candidatus Pacearchaeota archaeon]